jgi:hypothetical protein
MTRNTLLFVAFVFGSGCASAAPTMESRLAQADKCESVTIALGSEGMPVKTVRPVHRDLRVGKASVPRPAGAELYVQAEAERSVPYLQRALDCQHRREGGLLGVPSARARVMERDAHFVVRVEAPSTADARLLQANAATLVTR